LTLVGVLDGSTNLYSLLSNVQTLILHGIEDCVCMFDLAKTMHEDIKDSQLVQIEKADHGFYYEKRGRVDFELINFGQS